MKRLRLILYACIVCLLIYFGIPTNLSALDPEKAITGYNIQDWNLDSGLPGNSVYAIQQTQDGYIWIGTSDGLVRFDGVDFDLFNKEKTSQLKSSKIRALYEDRGGTLWIGTESGGLTYYKEGAFFNYPVTENKALYKIRAINEDHRGILWIGSLGKGLTSLEKGKFTTYTKRNGLPDDNVRFIFKDDDGDLWVVTESGVFKLLQSAAAVSSRVGERFRHYVYRDAFPYTMNVCLFENDTGNLWIGTYENGLFCLHDNKFTGAGSRAGLPHPTVTSLYRDRSKNLWIGTDGGGLSRLKDGQLSTLPGGGALTCGFVYSIYEDREGSLWVGTLEGGVHQLRDSKFITYTSREGLGDNYVNCVLEARDGALWIGTDGGLNRLEKGELTAVPAVDRELRNNRVQSLFEDSRGVLWIGTWAGVRQLKEGRISTLSRRDGLSDNKISSIIEDNRGNTWIGTSNGLNRLNKNKGKLTVTVFTTNQGLSCNIITFLFTDNRGDLWVGTDSGLDCLENGGFTPYNRAAPFKDKSFRCAFQDKEGTLWFGTESGLVRISPAEKESGLYTLFTVQSGLVEDYVYSILEDERGYLWLGGRNGISRLSKKELADFSAGLSARVQPDSYDEKDGMKSRWCTGPGCKTRDGRFWFPTGRGIAGIDPNRIEKPPASASLPLVIEKLVVDGETVNFHAGEKNGPPLELTPGKRRLEFYYTAVSFISPKDIKFKLKLVGYDKNWIDVGNIRSTNYTGLSPGHYTFRVTARSADGVWNEKEASFSFYLRPYFHQTPWFYFLAVLFGVLAISFIIRFRVRQLKTREKQLRLQEMDKIKSRFFANISHEFRTPLTLIMGPLEQMFSACRDKEERKKIGMMRRSAQRLLGLINQLLDLSKFESGKMKLQAARRDIVPFLKGIVGSFDSLAAQNELELTYRDEEENILLYFDAEKLDKVICNLLINAIKFTPPRGKISVTLKRSEEPAPGFLEISIKDTGIGIPAEKLEHIFDRFYQAEGLGEHAHRGSGIGLALAKESVSLHHGELFVRSEENKGSEFIVRLPLGDSFLKPGEIVDQPVESPGLKVQREIPELLPPDAVEEEAESIASAEIPGAGKEIILIVEDSADVRTFIKESLLPHYLVEEAGSGAEGIGKARRFIPDLIICDVMMPGVDGYEVCAVLKNDIETSHIPIILLTAKASEESIVRGLETGADDYITKPFSTKILCARIENLIDLRRQLQQNIQRRLTLQPGKYLLAEIDKKFMQKLQDMIENNLSDPDFNVGSLCDKLEMSRPTLYRKIHALSGENPTEFIRSHRLRKGAELLKNSAISVLEVALDVGFSSSAYFTKCFRERFQVLPTDYQAAHMKG